MIAAIEFSTTVLEGSKTLTTDVALTMAFAIVGGLGIFLLGMKFMSEGMQAVAGQRLRRMISAVTDNRIAGISTGTVVTCVVQSSSITTVLVVGFVTSGFMALHQAIGVIMGANIGTTITGWILVLKVGKYGLPILGVAAFVYLFSRVERRRFTALAIMGLGMVFYGLVLMKEGFKPVREIDAFREAFEWFDAGTFVGVLKCVLVGSILTGIVQSSSATLGITIAIASQGVISFETAAALVLGENIGTTVTAFLASIGTTTEAKRAAYFHILFNLVGVTVMIFVFRGYMIFVAEVVEMVKGVDPRALDIDSEDFATNITFAIAATHTGFNLTIALANLPFVRQWAAVLEKLVPDKEGKEIGHLTQLDLRLVESPAIGIERSHREIVKMGVGDLKMLRWAADTLDQSEPDARTVEKLFRREEVMDNVQAEIIRFLTDLLSANVPHSVANEARQQLRAADELESISDYISGIVKTHLKLVGADLSLDESQRKALVNLHGKVESFLEFVLREHEKRRRIAVDEAIAHKEAITLAVKATREAHLLRLSDDPIDPVHSLSYLRMMQGYRKISDHILNVAEVLAEPE